MVIRVRLDTAHLVFHLGGGFLVTCRHFIAHSHIIELALYFADFALVVSFNGGGVRPPRPTQHQSLCPWPSRQHSVNCGQRFVCVHCFTRCSQQSRNFNLCTHRLQVNNLTGVEYRLPNVGGRVGNARFCALERDDMACIAWKMRWLIHWCTRTTDQAGSIYVVQLFLNVFEAS